MDDLISRSALLREYGDFKDMDCPSGHTVTADYMIELAEDAPAVDAEPVRHGRWEPEVVKCRDWKGRQRDYFQPHSCSVCHKPDPNQGESNYCPNCGAKMRGADDA